MISSWVALYCSNDKFVYHKRIRHIKIKSIFFQQSKVHTKNKNLFLLQIDYIRYNRNSSLHTKYNSLDNEKIRRSSESKNMQYQANSSWNQITFIRGLCHKPLHLHICTHWYGSARYLQNIFTHFILSLVTISGMFDN